ncbi:amidohydrolase family protein [Dyella caseinilytica]|uniref:Amidohydrolase family protein n=1 Tax=Dyella caseinilytica TaxID=1849581 RepID=A0ABX7H0E7_9GAMM|nr:amidohydrolase family protein [Dyella caseinilytica]QRN55681.1 amidohydrolase family protein [Dyella caseinilytica]GGA03670.1 amidohydrolase [Dyella caseinilytica]
MIIVDAHQHYWQPSRGDYDWLADAPALLQRAFLPADMRAERKAAGVTFSILVQAAPSEEETRYLFELAELDPAVIGVVGWVDMEANDVEARIDALIRDGNGLLRGLRPMVQDVADPAWLSQPSLDRAFDCIEGRGLSFDALTSTPQFPALFQRLQRHPHLKVVLDHAGKPAIGAADTALWSDWIDKLSQHPQLHCKLSGLLTLLGKAAGEQLIEPYVAHLFARFGAERLMWGSDWPVLTTHASFSHWLELALELTGRYAPGSQADVFAANAARFYALDLGVAQS